jgi:hypothetical protein
VETEKNAYLKISAVAKEIILPKNHNIFNPPFKSKTLTPLTKNEEN